MHQGEDMSDLDSPSGEQSSSQEPKKRKTRRSRKYRHERCGGVTKVGDEDFSRLANPFTFVWSGTFCAVCEDDVSLEDVYWTDTDESIADYRRRVRKKAPLSMKLTGWVAVPLIGFVIGAAVGSWLIGGYIGFWGMAIMGLTLFSAFSMPTLSHFIWGIDYRQKK